MKPNIAQSIYLMLSTNANFQKDYKAPHANRGTMPKPHHPRKHLPFKMFKGHRP